MDTASEATENVRQAIEERAEELTARSNRHKAIRVVVNMVLDTVAEAVREPGKTDALDRLAITLGGYMTDDPDTPELLSGLPALAAAIGERTSPSNGKSPATDAFIAFVQSIDDKENGFNPDGSARAH